MAQKPDVKVTYLDGLDFYEQNIFTLSVGDVIFLDNSKQHYETFMENLKKYILATNTVSEFEVYPIIPGSEQFVIYGSGTFIVIKKSL